MKLKILFAVLFFLYSAEIFADTRWQIKESGAIEWKIDDRIPHYDHIEMSGLEVSVVLRYGVNEQGGFELERSMVWPMLRTLPNDTYSSLMHRFAVDNTSMLMVDGRALTNEKVESISLDGRLTVVSKFSIAKLHGSGRSENTEPVVEMIRTFFPSTTKPMLCESYELKNITDKAITVIVPQQRAVYNTNPATGLYGSYTMVASIIGDSNKLYELQPGELLSFEAAVQAFREGQQELKPNIKQEELARKEFVFDMWDNLKFSSPNNVINVAFAFAKVRAAESIFATKGGLMHSPGGETYYAALWANDQAEYANPFFPFLGYEIGNGSAINSFRHFARFMNTEYRPIPSSIIAEGLDIWHGAGDRGDGAMIAYGAARYALQKANMAEARELWPLIEWCLEFCKRKLNNEGVVQSDTDELENRFPAGEANLCTSSLYYDALISASYLARELKRPISVSKQYAQQAKELRANIIKYFSANIDGFETFKYYKSNDILRSWIAIPMTMGIYDRKEGTIAALLSPSLWTNDGLLTQAGTSTFWDRSTLYALRGIYSAGERETATEYMSSYSKHRLLCDHVPYPIEAWPEGNQRHLSAESALYCRIVTEGMFGIRPTGFNSFTLSPQLPQDWENMELSNIYAFANSPFTISVSKDGDKIRVIITKDDKVLKSYKIENGTEISVKL